MIYYAKMNAKQLYNTILNNSAGDKPNMSQIDSAYKQYLISHCYHPLKVKVYDSHKGCFVEKSVPCGHCYHCRETKINEWVTRLYAHADSAPYKFVYFITLTYRSFTPVVVTDPYESYILNYLAGAFFHYDNKNYNHQFGWNPCILCKDHYQRFFKRLRKNTGIVNMTYFGCGEYGHKFGRPHYHFIIFSPDEIKRSDIVQAWGLYLSIDLNGNVCPASNKENPVFCSFGNVDFNDLVSNGTLAKSVNIDGQKYNGDFAFHYVAKYVAKDEYNKTRVKIYVDSITQKTNDSNEFKNYDEDENITRFIHRSDLFCAARPFLACSRGVPIGSLFVKTHIETMAAGVYPTPKLLQDNTSQRTCIVPTYFRKKASEYVFRLRAVSERGSLSKGNLPQLAATLAYSCNCEIPELVSRTCCVPNSINPKIPICTFSDVNTALRSKGCFVDVWTKHRYLIVLRNNEFLVEEYTFNRRFGWFLCNYHTLFDFSMHYLTSMPADFLEYNKQHSRARSNEIYIDLINKWYDENSPDSRFLIEQVEKDNTNFFNMRNVSRFNDSTL